MGAEGPSTLLSCSAARSPCKAALRVPTHAGLACSVEAPPCSRWSALFAPCPEPSPCLAWSPGDGTCRSHTALGPAGPLPDKFLEFSETGAL